MIDKDKIITVVNRNLGRVGYTVPDLNVRRQFAPGESKDLPMDELRKLSYLPGGQRLIKHYLIIEDQDAVAELLGAVEPEYNYTEADVRELLTNGSLEQLLDCLDFAPNGVLEMIKTLSVSLELNDVKKREVIQQKTGFNVSKAIEINRETKTSSSEDGDFKPIRRTSPIVSNEETTKERRVATPQKVTIITQQ